MQGAGQLYYLKLKRKLPPPHKTWGGAGVVVWSHLCSWASVALLPHRHPLLASGVIALVFGPGVVVWHPSTHCLSHISTPFHPTSSGLWQWLGVRS